MTDIAIDFSKVISPDFDRLELRCRHDSEWFHIVSRYAGGKDDPVTADITIRHTETVRDLHYALGRYLALLDASR